jgi:hypothetical protein
VLIMGDHMLTGAAASGAVLADELKKHLPARGQTQ